MIILISPDTQYTMVGREQDMCHKPTIWGRQELEITERSPIQSTYHVLLGKNSKAYFPASDLDPCLANVDGCGRSFLVRFLPWLKVPPSWKIFLSIILRSHI